MARTLHEARKYLPPETHTSLGLFVVHRGLSLSSLLVRVLLAVFLILMFATVFAYCYKRLNAGRKIPLTLVGETFSFAVAGALTISLLLALTAGPLPPDGMKTLFELSLVMAALVATFSFYTGLLGGLWLGARSKRIRSAWRLVAESAVAGLVLGNLVPLLLFSPLGLSTYFVSGVSAARDHRYFARIAIVFSSLVGLVLAEMFALIFRRRLISEDRTAG